VLQLPLGTHTPEHALATAVALQQIVLAPKQSV